MIAEADYMTLNGKTYTRRIVYRQPHDQELLDPGPEPRGPARNYRGDAGGTFRDTKTKTIPETFRLLPEHQTPLDCACQRLIRNMNPNLRDDCVDDILDQAWILANNTGLGAVGRKNCRSGDYMNDPNAKWPAFHAVIWCGGSQLPGVRRDGNVYLESVLTSEPIPSADEVMARGLYFHLTEISPTGRITYMTLGGKDGQRYPVIVPLITRLPVYAPALWLQEMDTYIDPRSFA